MSSRDYEAPDMAAFMCRVARALVRRAADGDLEVLSALAKADDAVADAMVQAARELHEGRYQYTWAQIADQLGITRQAAQQRFGRSETA